MKIFLMKKLTKYPSTTSLQLFYLIFSPRTSVNKRFCQIIFVSIIIVILLCGSFLLPFYLIKITQNNEIHNNADDETSGKGNSNVTEADCSRQTGQKYLRSFLSDINYVCDGYFFVCDGHLCL